jgi:hypothetical protein
MDDFPDEILPDLSPQLIEVTEKQIALYKATQLASTTARTGFHEKLVVITAGSLTIVATMATNIYIKPFADKILNHQLLDALAWSAVSFFLSLIASVIHNFMETEALHFDFLEAQTGGIRKIMQSILNSVLTDCTDEKTINETKKIVRDSVDIPFSKIQTARFNKSQQHRNAERWVSIAAVIFFIAGYTPIIVLVIHLSRT